ncbi:hypothetical protein K492DRAFT_76399 [Lichtheimia hyalospora FSU 10163]|nr:hypothetical protein K492DRAFT_76399 [Lichtheimia hyalospora FSU 10163]
MPPTRSRSTTVTRKTLQRNSTNITQQQSNESSAAADVPAAPLATASRPIAQRKRVRSRTDLDDIAPPKTPKRSKAKIPVHTQAVQERLERALEQRMYVVNRTLLHDHHIQFHVLGSTGNYYTVDITKTLKCSCYDYRYRRVHCKHLLLVLARVFHVHGGSPAYSKLSLSKKELEKVFANCAPDPAIMVDDTVKAIIDNELHGVPVQAEEEEDSSVNRKSLDEADCPICYESLAEEQLSIIIFCKTCGNNVHEDCFQQWSRQLAKRHQTVTCVFCRSAWETSKRIAKPKKSISGFANFAQHTGLPFE